MAKIGSDILSQIIQRSLGRHTTELQDVHQRLASGKRINRPADDPSGLALASSLNLQSRVANHRLRGIDDAISLTSVAEGAVDALTKVVERLKELSLQSSNGSFTANQRSIFDKEAQALAAEYNRIARSTAWNGYRIFDASFGAVSLSTSDVSSVASTISSTLGGTIGTGALDSQTSYGSGASKMESQLADFNGDGILDIASTSDAGQISMLLGNGDGTFRTGASMSAITSYFLKAGDVNGDSKVDLVLSNLNPAGGLYTYLGNGDGTFTLKSISATSGSMKGLQLEDLTGDGVLDLAAVSDNTNLLNIFRGNGDGTFTQTQTLATPSSPEGLQVGDFTGDGRPDIIASGLVGTAFTLYTNQGSGTFSISSNTSGSPPQDVSAVGDFNEDGKLDFVAVQQNSSRLALYLGNGDGTFNTPQYLSTAAFPYAARALDLNGDGHLDLAATSLTNSYVNILLGNGDGSFQTVQTYSAPNSPRYLDVGDVNGDGVPDLVVPKYNDGTVGVFLGSTTAGIGNLQPFSLLNAAGAREASYQFSRRHEALTKQRAQIGSLQERLDFALSQQRTIRGSLKEAEGRILDVDIAHETTKLIRAQVGQQFAVALLAQSRQDGATVMKLLSGV